MQTKRVRGAPKRASLRREQESIEHRVIQENPQYGRCVGARQSTVAMTRSAVGPRNRAPGRVSSSAPSRRSLRATSASTSDHHHAYGPARLRQPARRRPFRTFNRIEVAVTIQREGAKTERPQERSSRPGWPRHPRQQSPQRRQTISGARSVAARARCAPTPRVRADFRNSQALQPPPTRATRANKITASVTTIHLLS